MTPTAQLFVVLSVAAGLTYSALGFRALGWNLRGRGNQALALLCAGCGTWALCMALILTSETRADALFWYQVAATGWLVAPPAALHSYLRLTHPEWIDRTRWLELLLYLPAPIFIIRNWTGFVGPIDVLQTRHGWVESVASFDAWYVAYVAYLMIYGAATVTSSALRWRVATTRTERVQSIWLTLGGLVLIPLIAGFGLVMPVVRPGLPEVSHLIALVWVLAAWKAMQIRNPWRLTPQLVADQLLEALSEAVLITDPEGRLQIANPAAERLFGNSSRELAGSHISLLVPLRGTRLIEGGKVRTDVKNLELEIRSAHSGEFRPPDSQSEKLEEPESALPERRSDPPTHWYSISTAAVLDQLEEHAGALITLRDITATKAAEHELEYRATHDPLTNLANRHLLESRLQSAAQEPSGHYLAVLLIDLDGFKAINDRHGHAIGDHLLANLGKRLRGCLRRDDTAARVGGDEFVVLLPKVAGVERSRSVAQRLLAACRRPFEIEGGLLSIDASIGIAVGVAGTTRPDDILRAADQAMYQAKGEREVAIVVAQPGVPGPPRRQPRAPLEN